MGRREITGNILPMCNHEEDVAWIQSVDKNLDYIADTLESAHNTMKNLLEAINLLRYRTEALEVKVQGFKVEEGKIKNGQT